MRSLNEIRRRNRRTGTLITAYQDGYLSWITVCEDHDRYREHRTRDRAVRSIAVPELWCDKCRAQTNLTAAE